MIVIAKKIQIQTDSTDHAVQYMQSTYFRLRELGTSGRFIYNIAEFQMSHLK